MSTISCSSTSDDAHLVERSLAGDRQAFAQIVVRYQSLICALAYSATGSRSHSEDLAQETFVTAWRGLRDLRKPGQLRAWLCGIARNVIHGDLRRLGRQPAHEADPIDNAHEVASAELQPTAQAVSNEEMALLWREVGRLPEIYREPLILFYREHQSAEQVAAALEISTDAVMQRLARGRRQLHERMLQFVETTLERSRPGPQFTLQVSAALPLLAGAGPAATMVTAAKGGGAAAGGALGVLLAWAAPLTGVFAAIGVSCAEIAHAPSKRERRFLARWMLALWLCVAGLVVALPVVSSLTHSTPPAPQDWRMTAPLVAVWLGFALATVTLIIVMHRGKAAFRRQRADEAAQPASAPASVSWKWRFAALLASLIAGFWILIFLAWQAGDPVVAGAIAAVVCLLASAPFGWPRRRAPATDDGGGWHLTTWGLVFLGFLNWRLDVWLAPIYGVDLDAMHRLLPMGLIHWLSVLVIGWTAALVFVTQPDER